MNVAPHLVRLYIRTSRRYKKLISKLQRNAGSSYQRKTFLHELKKLVKLLRGLRARMKIAAATGTLMVMLNANQVEAQTIPTTLGPFIKHNRLTNPLREPIFTRQQPALATVDFDADGDLDIVVGEYGYDGGNGGYLRYFENQSTQGHPLYLELVDKENPFSAIRSQTTGVAPAFADIDGDGDLDLFLGQNGWTAYNAPGGIEYYRNDKGVFAKQSGPWDPLAKTGNPFDGLSLGTNVRPVFVDFDKDGDQDIIIGSYVYAQAPDYITRYVHYYENDGSGNFKPSPITADISSYSYGPISPALADLDEDGDYDIVLGSYNYEGRLFYLQQATPGNFTVVSEAWDPLKKTGNPFQNFAVENNASPAFIDFDNDGNLDLFVADENKYSKNIIHYYKNSNINVFEEKVAFENPFGGIYVDGYASPVLLDVDGDSKHDAVIGNKYSGGYYDQTGQWIYTYSTLKYYKNTEAGYSEITDETHSLNQPELDGYFSPQFVDVDGDGDLDIISGGGYGQVVFFRNDNGIYVNEIELNPFAGINAQQASSSARLVDIDNDSDPDVFMTNTSGEILYYQNNNGEYLQRLGPDNPLDMAAGFSMFAPPFLTFTDIDHDGDLDVFFGGPSSYQRTGDLLYFENTGTKEQPLFTSSRERLFPGVDNQAPQAHFTDYDQDGDLDAFIGNLDGTVSYFENGNPAPAVILTDESVLYEPAVHGAVVIAPDLTVEDGDDDPIIQALVSIADYQTGETLGFTPHDGITGYFDTETGILRFTGRSTRATYQSLLRTVTLQVSAAASGRQKSVQSTTPKNIAFTVYDLDFTNPQAALKTVNIFVNSPPAIDPVPVSNSSDLKRSINLMEITSDVDDNLDPNRFTIVSQPLSGAKATIAFVSPTEVNLIIDFKGINYTGSDQITIRACDAAGACTERLLSLEVDIYSGIIVYNALAPNSAGDNHYMRISGLPPVNNVRIFNRWGDKVYEVENYQNTEKGNAFRGQNDQGNDLPSGTYFYTIEIPGQKKVMGYVTLKR